MTFTCRVYVQVTNHTYMQLLAQYMQDGTIHFSVQFSQLLTVCVIDAQVGTQKSCGLSAVISIHLYMQFLDVAKEIWEKTGRKKIDFILVSPMDNSFHESTRKLLRSTVCYSNMVQLVSQTLYSYECSHIVLCTWLRGVLLQLNRIPLPHKLMDT